jgi:hypothetical protein
MRLTRKKIKVRGKSGKTFQRSVMVRAEAIGKRAGGKKLNSLNPWEAHHTELVKGPFPKSSGTSGPGSNHSLLAYLTGQLSRANRAQYEHPRGESYTKGSALDRQAAGEHSATRAREDQLLDGHQTAIHNAFVRTGDYRAHELRSDLIYRHGRDNIHEVHQDPRKWVR